MAEILAAHAGVKRPHPESASSGQPLKKRKVRRSLQHIQVKPTEIEPAPQDAVFVQGQLLRSITVALVKAGFDGVKPTALEMFRGCVEEYMLEFLTYAHSSMQSARRTAPTAQDFATALSFTPNALSASLLKPQLDLELPEAISCPQIPQPDSMDTPPPNFSVLLGPLVTFENPEWVPKHFPTLPPQHAWKHTPVYAQREKDARKMREKATEEGILAERALRKLAAAAKTGAIQSEKRKGNTLAGHGKLRSTDTQKRGHRPREAPEEMFGDMLKEIGGADEAKEARELDSKAMKELKEEGVDIAMPEGVVVNWDMGAWRRGGRK